MSVHRATHTGDRPFLHPQCDKKFINKVDLGKSHSDVLCVGRVSWGSKNSTLIKPFTKTTILFIAQSVRTASKDWATLHRTWRSIPLTPLTDAHTVADPSSRPFHCKKCRSFARPPKSQSSWGGAHDKRCYNCSQCGLAFKSSSTLRSHMIIHSKTVRLHHLWQNLQPRQDTFNRHQGIHTRIKSTSAQNVENAWGKVWGEL